MSNLQDLDQTVRLKPGQNSALHNVCIDRTTLIVKVHLLSTPMREHLLHLGLR